MNNDTFGLDVVQASELKYAWARNGGTNADLKALSSGDMVAQILPVVRGYGRVVVEVLEKLGEVLFPGSSRFVATEKFTEPKFLLSDNFKAWMLPKVEDEVKSSTRAYGQLVQATKDAVIVASLGGEEKAETSLSEMFHLLELQADGKEGVLLTNGWANIFYVRDHKGVLRTVSAYWYGGVPWKLVADPVSYPVEWPAGNRVFSWN